MTTNTKESGLEEIIVNILISDNCYELCTNEDYNRNYTIDEIRLFSFLLKT